MPESVPPLIGKKAPSFSLKDQNGKTHALSAYKGRHVVLYFYPKDDTPGCTREACAFRDSDTELQTLGAVVLGVSRDDVDSHKKFAEKYTLNFPLLADTTGEICEAYGVWKEKNLYGKTSMGIERSTFLIDRDGVVRKVWRGVRVDNHSADVLEALRAL